MKTKRKASAIDQTIGINIYYLRQLKGISQEVLSNKLDVSIQQIQKYEKGVNRISASTLHKLAKFFNTDINSFFTLKLRDGLTIAQLKRIGRGNKDIAALIDSLEIPKAKLIKGGINVEEILWKA